MENIKKMDKEQVKLGVEENLTEEHQQQDKQPKTYRDGVLQVTEWENTTNDGEKTFYTYTIQRSYNKEKDAQKPARWANTGNLRQNDLLKVAKLLEKAYSNREQ